MTSTDVFLFIARILRGPEFLHDRWIIGLPGWRFYLGRDWERRVGIVLRWAWRERAYWREGEMRYHFYVEIMFGRIWESVADFGGPCWCPWPITQQVCHPYAIRSWDGTYSPRWTGRTIGWVGIDWPRLSFNFYRIPEDSR